MFYVLSSTSASAVCVHSHCIDIVCRKSDIALCNFYTNLLGYSAIKPTFAGRERLRNNCRIPQHCEPPGFLLANGRFIVSFIFSLFSADNQ